MKADLPVVGPCTAQCSEELRMISACDQARTPECLMDLRVHGSSHQHRLLPYVESMSCANHARKMESEKVRLCRGFGR